MAEQIDIEREFAKGCVVWMIRKRNPSMPLEFLYVKQGDEEPDQSNQVDINQTFTNYERVYEAINSYAVNNEEKIEAKYCTFFCNYGTGDDATTLNDLLINCAYDIYVTPFSYEIIIAICAYASVFAYIFYRRHHLQEAVQIAISNIASHLKTHGFNESKYMELKLFAENFS